MKRIIDLRILLLLSILFISGCVKDSLEPDQSSNNSSSKEMVSVELNFKIPAPTKPETKELTKALKEQGDFDVLFFDEPQTKSSGTTKLHNLWVFQFDETGKKVVGQKMSDAITPVNDMAKLAVNLVKADNQTIYIVALGKLFDSNLSGITTIAQLEEQNLNYLTISGAEYISRIKSDDEIPYAGRTDGVDIIKLDNSGKGLLRFDKPSGFTGGVLIERLVSKLSLKYKFDVTGYKMTGAVLMSVPKMISIKPSLYVTTQGPAFVSLKAEVGKTLDAEGFYTLTWYAAQNQQGEVETINSSGDRNIKNAPTNATSIKIWAQHNTNVNDYATYSIYVGRNNTTDFNLDANGTYNLITEIFLNINTAQNDDRVDAFTLTSDIELYASAKSGTGSKSPSGTQYDLDSHYDFRPLTIGAAGSNIEIQLLDVSGNPITNPADQWLKISEYPNYTEAVQNKDLRLSATATLVTPTQLKYYLYADEYVNHKTSNLRSLKVRVKVVSTDGTANNTVDFTLSQRPIINLGYWGGKLGTSQYESLLGSDQISECSILYSDYKYFTSAGPVWGYYGTDANASYGIYNRETGKDATKKFAENVSKKAGGSNGNKKDLYQYNYYNTYSTRFCYDRNRDNNGDGEIDDSEMRWYLPAQKQMMGFYVQTGSSRWPFTGVRYWVTYDINTSTALFLAFDNGLVTQDGKTKTNVNVRCVRDLIP